MSGDHHNTDDSGPAARVKALEALLTEKGLIDPSAIDAIVDTYETRVGPRNGARVVAKASTDPAYHKRLLADATSAVAELGFAGPEVGTWWQSITPTASTISSYARSAHATRGRCWVCRRSGTRASRTAREPSAIRAAFSRILDFSLPPDVEVRVWDSSAEIRCSVIPQRPKGTAKMSEDQLAEIVTRDSMVGVAKVEAPRA